MKKYKINFIDLQGNEKENISEFSSTDSIAEYASANKYFIKKIVDLSDVQNLNENFNARASSKNLMLFTWQLAVMLNSGAVILESLKLLCRQFSDQKFKLIIYDITTKIENGALFSSAIAEYPLVFSRSYISAVKAGESGGNIGQVLSSLAEYIDKREALKTRLKSILTYPVILLTIATSGIFFLLMFVLPKFVRIFLSLGVESKTISFLMFFSDFLKNFAMPFIVTVFILCFGFYVVSKIIKRSEYFDLMILKIPFIGNLVSKINQAMFANSLQILLDSGSPIISAVQISAETMPNIYISKKVFGSARYIENGEPLHKALEHTNLFSDISLHLISVGEKSGTLPEMLKKVNGYYTREVEYTLSDLLVIIEPAVLVILGVVVCLIAISIFLPITDFINAMQRR